MINQREERKDRGYRRRRVSGRSWGGRWTALAALAVFLPACDTDATNPGPVDGEFLRDADAQPALVRGMARAYSEGHNWIGYTGAAVARELHPAGSTGSFGIAVRWQAGRLEAEDDALNAHWNNAQQARWLADEGIRIMQEEGAPDELLGEAFLWAGFANRLLGENYCQTTIDGSEPLPNTVHFERAEEAFTQAIQIGTPEVAEAARAGRASIFVNQGRWPEAVNDANQIPGQGLLWEAEYFDGFGDPQRNRITWASFAEPYKAHTQWNTKYADIGFNPEMNPTGDPRTPWRFTEEVGDAAIPCCGNVSWWPQQKFPQPESNIPLAQREEMRLIEAEDMLRNGAWQEAIEHINSEIRIPAGVPETSASSSEEAWSLLKHERGIVLWLQARRLADLRRWRDNNTPGALDELEQIGPNTNLERQDLCFPIARSEQDTNNNVPLMEGPGPGS